MKKQEISKKKKVPVEAIKVARDALYKRDGNTEIMRKIDEYLRAQDAR